jgi:hypothetical protein
VFAPGKPFQSSLMFAGKAVAYPSEHLSDAPPLAPGLIHKHRLERLARSKHSSLLRRRLALPTNIRPGWKGLPGANTLAYYDCKKVL